LFIAAAASASEEECPDKKTSSQDIGLPARNLQEVCKKLKHISLTKREYLTFVQLGNMTAMTTAHLIILAAIHVTVLHIHEEAATLYSSLKVRDTLACLSLFWETLTSVKTDSGRNMHG